MQNFIELSAAVDELSYLQRKTERRWLKTILPSLPRVVIILVHTEVGIAYANVYSRDTHGNDQYNLSISSGLMFMAREWTEYFAAAAAEAAAAG